MIISNDLACVRTESVLFIRKVITESEFANTYYLDIYLENQNVNWNFDTKDECDKYYKEIVNGMSS